MKAKSTIILFLFLMLVSINTVSAVQFYESDADYGFSNGVMTDNTNLTYETNINGVVTVNDERFLAFALKGTYAGTEYTYTSMDYDWTWTHTVDGTDHTFEAINNNDNFVWKQYWYFHEDQPMKIEHYLKNNYPEAITDMEMYYITTVQDTDTIQYNGSDYIVGDVKPLFVQKDLNDIEASINFNDEYDFNFMDIVSEGFDINEFYLGSGSVIGYPAIDIMAVGFTKGTGTLNQGQEVWIDPTFSTHDIESVATCPFGNNSYILAWGDESDDNKYFKIMWTNGTIRVDTTSIGDHGSVYYTSLDVVALNSTHWIYVYKNADTYAFYADIYNVGSKITTKTIAANVWANSFSFGVDAANETRWGVIWHDDINNKLYHALYDYDTKVGGNVEVAGLNSGYAQDIFFFNDTHYGVTWWDTDPDDIFFAIYQNKNKIGSTITVDDDAVSSSAVKGVALTDEIFVVAYNDGGEADQSFRTYYSNGTAITAVIDVNTDVGLTTAYSIGLTKKNSTHIYIGVNDDDSNNPHLALYHYDGTEVYNLDKGTIGDDYIDVTSSKHATGIGFDDESAVMMWAESATKAVWGRYFANGSLYEAPDTTGPTYSNDAHNTTVAGASCSFSIDYNDNTALETLGQYIFATNNTGVWVNESAINFTSTPETINTVKTLNSTVGLTIGYRWYADDNAGNVANTPIYTLVTTVIEYTPPDPISLANSTSNFWINYTWSAGSGNVTDSYNVSQNGSWTNGSSDAFMNTEVGAHGYSDIVVYAYNNSGDGTLSAGTLTDNVTVPNNAITISNVSASYILNEGETLYIDANYADADSDTGVFADNSSDWNVNTATGVVSWVPADGEDGTYNWYINVTDGYGSVDTQAFTVTVNNSIYPPTVTLVTFSPTPFLTNYTGATTISYMVASSDPLNLSSLAFLYGLNYTIPAGGDMQNYISGPANSIAFEGIYRAPNRNVTPYLTWETNDTITEGNVWKWGGGDNNSWWISKTPINSTHTWVNVTGITEHVLASSFYLQKLAMYNAPKTAFEVNRAQGLIFKMWNVEEIRNRNANYFANLYFDTSWESTEPTDPIEIGYCNDSYNPSTDDIDLSPYCVKFGEWNGTRWVNHSWDPGANASYASPLTVNASDFTDPCPDDTNYIWLRSNTISSKSYVLNATNHDPGICNLTFAQTETFWTYNEINGVTTSSAYTPSFFTTFARNDEELLHHLYIADDTGEWGHSEIFNESIGISSVPISAVSFEHFNVSCGDEYVNDTLMDANYDDGNIDIRIHFPADPDGGNATHNITLHHADNETFVAVVNNSITTTGDEYLDISFSTTPYYSGTNYYTLKCVSTDDEGSVATKWLISDFTLDADGNQGFATDDVVQFWGMNDIPTLYTTISNNSLISYNAGDDIYTMHKPFFKAKCNDTFNFNETVHLKSLNNEDVAYFRYWGSVVFDNATILAWNTTLDSPAPITDTYRGYVYTYFHAEGNITNSNFSYLGSDFYRQEGLNFVEITDDYLIHNTTFSNNAEGLVMEECTDFTISNSTITDNVNVGVGVYFTNSTTIENSTITSNGGRGVSIYEGNDNTIRYNDISDSGTHGIHSWANSDNNTYTGNNITSNTLYDYYFTSSATDNHIIDTASSADLIRLTSSCDINIENTDNAAFIEDSSKTSYAYLTNFSMYVSGITETFNITQTGMVVTPSTDNLSMWNIDQTGNFSFNASSDTSDNPTWFNITNISWANHNVAVYRNGTIYANETADDTGFMDYNYTGGYSEKWFEFVLGGISNFDNFTFSNAAISPTTVRENSPFTVSVDISDYDGNITEAIVKISGNNYTMVQGVGDTWSYTFTATSLPTEYYVTDFYAKDNNNAWNSTTSTLTIDVVSSTGGGGSGGISPVVTPTPIIDEAIEEIIEVLPDVNITDFVSNITDVYERYKAGNYKSMFNVNLDNKEKTYSKDFYVVNPVYCSVFDNSTYINHCAVNEDVVTVSMDFIPADHGLFLSTRDYVEIGDKDGGTYYVNIDVLVINLASLYTLENLILVIIILLVFMYFKRNKK